MKNIDFEFIEKLEGFELKGYVPDPKNSQSGVTIASGFDIGARTSAELDKLFKPEIANKLKPYVGLKKESALNALKLKPLTVTKEQAREINAVAHKQSIDRLVKSFNAVSKIHFEQLTKRQATVIASVSFQYGDLSKKTPNFWKQVTSHDWVAVVKNLRNFGDRYKSRRNKEADFLEGK